MKIEKALLLWNPRSDGAAVIEHPARGRGREYVVNVGACLTSWKKLSQQEQALELVLEAWQAEIRDGVKPQGLHEAMLQIEEITTSSPRTYRG